MPRMSRQARIAALIAELDAKEQARANQTPEQREQELRATQDRMDENVYRYGYKIGCQPTSANLAFALDGLSYADKKILRKGYKDAQTYAYGYERDMPARRDVMSLEEREESRKGSY